MTRVCAWCKKFLGEGCPECGEDVTFHRSLASGRIEAVCVNQKCAMNKFLTAESGVTHGICESCAKIRFPQKQTEIDFDKLAAACVAGRYELEEAVRVFRVRMIEAALEETGGHQIEASKLIRCHRNTIHRNLEDERLRRKPVEPIRAHEVQRQKGGAA